MAPIADVAGPQRRQAILPPPYRWIGRASVLDEDEPAARPENAPHLGERRARTGMLHSVHVISTVSTRRSSTGSVSADAAR